MLSFYYQTYKIDTQFPCHIRKLLLMYREGIELDPSDERRVLFHLANIIVESEDTIVCNSIEEYEEILKPYQTFPAHPSPTKPSDLPHIYQMYQDGMTANEIAKEYNTNVTHIYARLREIKKNNCDQNN